jgi:hypothetical protein
MIYIPLNMNWDYVRAKRKQKENKNKQTKRKQTNKINKKKLKKIYTTVWFCI